MSCLEEGGNRAGVRIHSTWEQQSYFLKMEKEFWRRKTMPLKSFIKVMSTMMSSSRKKRMAQKEAPGSNEAAWEKAVNARPGPSMNCWGEGL